MLKKTNPMLNFGEIKKEIELAENPVIIFDDDPDGLCSFLLFYRHIKRGKGIVAKSTPVVDVNFLNSVKSYNPDKVFILDLAIVSQEFINEVGAPVVWVDHHSPLKRQKVKYFNPRVVNPDAYYPTSLIAYNTLHENLWIAVVGIVGDWLVPDFIDEFRKKYPDLIGDSNDIEEITFNTRLGELIHIFSMLLKGKSHTVMQCVKVLTRIESPYEILDRKTPAGRFIYRHYKYFDEKFQELLKRKGKNMGKLYVFRYNSNKTSFTPDLAKHLIRMHPEKVVIVARENNGEMKMSIRSRYYKINDALKFAMEGLDGYGGGHEYSCGGNIKKADFMEFLKRFNDYISHMHS